MSVIIFLLHLSTQMVSNIVSLASLFKTKILHQTLLPSWTTFLFIFLLSLSGFLIKMCFTKLIANIYLSTYEHGIMLRTFTHAIFLVLIISFKIAIIDILHIRNQGPEDVNNYLKVSLLVGFDTGILTKLWLWRPTYGSIFKFSFTTHAMVNEFSCLF